VFAFADVSMSETSPSVGNGITTTHVKPPKPPLGPVLTAAPTPLPTPSPTPQPTPAPLPSPSSAWVNNGVMTIASSGEWTGVRLTHDTTLSGIGRTVLSGPHAFISSGSTGRRKLVIAAEHTLSGAGHLGYDPGYGANGFDITNKGSLIANAGSLSLHGGLDNQGILATSSSGVSFVQGDLNNSGGLITVATAGGALGNGVGTGSDASVEHLNKASISNNPGAPHGGQFGEPNLGASGRFMQSSTGVLRLFIGGNARMNFGGVENGPSYSQLSVGEELVLDGELQLVLQPELLLQFGHRLSIGDTFDFARSQTAVSLSSNLRYSVFVTAAGKHLIDGLSFSQYSSGYVGDPDSLYKIGETVFSFDLSDDGTVLRGTLVQEISVTAVPEPSAYLLLLSGIGAIVAMLRRKRLKLEVVAL
jgi:hypothetical protein